MSGTNDNGKSGGLPFDEGMCERYLFGELGEAEQEIFEEAYFADDAFFNRYMSVKDEILDLYARGELDPDRRRRFESHFPATAPRRQRVVESRDFIRSITVLAERATPQSVVVHALKSDSFVGKLRAFLTLPALATATGIILIAVIGIWIGGGAGSEERAADPPASSNFQQDLLADQGTSVPHPNGTNGQPANAELTQRPTVSDERDVAVNPRVPSNIAPVVPSRSSTPIPTRPVPEVTPAQDVAQVPPSTDRTPEATEAQTEHVTLSSASRSITKSSTAVIGPTTRRVVLRLLFAGEAYARYSVRIATIAGESVWSASNLKSVSNNGAKAISVTVPATSLLRADYLVLLEGLSANGRSETVQEYYFHVDRR